MFFLKCPEIAAYFAQNMNLNCEKQPQMVSDKK